MGARDLLAEVVAAGLSITADGDRLLIRPRDRLTDDMRGRLRAAKPELLRLLASPLPRRCRLGTADAERCHAGGWSEAEVAAFVARHARLIALGLTDGDADDLAERLVLRDRDGDDRRLCVECAHYRGERCRQPDRADLAGREVGALALVLQRCPAFGPTGGASC